LGDMPATFAFSVSEAEACATVRAFFRSPINFIDTARSYRDSERRIGIVLRELGGIPAGYVLASKADRDETTGDFSGSQMRRSVERSLQLLGVDQLPICYLHDPEHTTFTHVMAPGGPLDVLRRMREEGLIAHLGVAGGPIDMSIAYVESGAFDAVITHNRYTLLNQSAAPLLDLAAARGLAVVNAAPYGSGILAKGPAAYARYAYQDAPPELLERARRLEALCRRHQAPLAAVALQFSLRDPRIHSTIVGMSRPERIEQTIALARHPVPNELWDEVRAVPAAHDNPEAERWRR
ncbi:MAG: aldo/keto reductase, partial [Actinobacteria bacterium]|nr:aldo/keto reductase [Actinomycetota bacterium]